MDPERPEGQPITLFVPGPWTSAEPCLAALDGNGDWSVEWIANDGRFAEAFAFGAFPKNELRKLEECPGAVVVEGRLTLPRDAAALETAGAALASAGGLGIRVEQSKGAWAFEPWLELIREGTGRALFRALVVGLTEDGAASVCGMHLFARPDAHIEMQDVDEAHRLLGALCVYQLDEDPLLRSGHTFRPDEQTPRVMLERWPDARYPEGHPCHNPFGVWELGPPAKKPRQHGELAIVPVPSLVALLLAAERKAGRPLKRTEVESMRDQAACITMSHEMARSLEVSRGYADIDLELAWEQWQVARRALGRRQGW